MLILPWLTSTGGTVDVESVTEASLRVVTCSGALKLGKIKASSVDIDTAGESPLCIRCQQVRYAPSFRCIQSLKSSYCWVLPGWGDRALMWV